MREDVQEIIDEFGKEYTTVSFTVSSEGVWGKEKTESTSTEKMLIINKIEGEELLKEGQKKVAYYIILANYNCSLEIGDKIVINNEDTWIRAIQHLEAQGGVFGKRITAMSEEWK